MFLSLSMYFIGFLGFILNRRHVILALLSIELMLLAVTVIALIGCSANGLGSLDLMGFALGLYIIVIAGAESAIGLALVVSYHRNHGQIYLD